MGMNKYCFQMQATQLKVCEYDNDNNKYFIWPSIYK